MENGGTVKDGVAFTQMGKPVNGPDSGVKCFSCGGNHYASRCPETTQHQKDELYSDEAKAKRNALRTKKGVNQLTTESSGSSSGSKESAKAGAAAAGSGAATAAKLAALGGYTAEKMKLAVELLNVLEAGVNPELDDDGVCDMLLHAFPDAPQQMAGVALLAPRIFPKEKHPAKKVSFACSVA